MKGRICALIFPEFLPDFRSMTFRREVLCVLMRTKISGGRFFAPLATNLICHPARQSSQEGASASQSSGVVIMFYSHNIGIATAASRFPYQSGECDLRLERERFVSVVGWVQERHEPNS